MFTHPPYEKTDFGTRTRVKTERNGPYTNDSTHVNCIHCGRKTTNYVKRTALKEYVIGGIPIKQTERTENTYCLLHGDETSACIPESMRDPLTYQINHENNRYYRLNLTSRHRSMVKTALNTLRDCTNMDAWMYPIFRKFYDTFSGRGCRRKSSRRSFVTEYERHYLLLTLSTILDDFHGNEKEKSMVNELYVILNEAPVYDNEPANYESLFHSSAIPDAHNLPSPVKTDGRYDVPNGEVSVHRHREETEDCPKCRPEVVAR